MIVWLFFGSPLKKWIYVYIYAITLLAGVFLKRRRMEMISSLHRHCHIIYTLLFRKWKHVFLLLNVLFFLDSFFHGFQTHVSSPTAISGWIYFISFCSRNLNNLKFMKILLFLWPFWLFFMRFLNCNVLLICCFVLWFCCLFLGFLWFLFCEVADFLNFMICLCFLNILSFNCAMFLDCLYLMNFVLLFLPRFFEIVYSLPDVYSSFVVIFPELYVYCCFLNFPKALHKSSFKWVLFLNFLNGLLHLSDCLELYELSVFSEFSALLNLLIFRLLWSFCFVWIFGFVWNY